MTSSLVGSEMCIRDRLGVSEVQDQPGSDAGAMVHQAHAQVTRTQLSVSYTHLTLPTSVDLGGR
eukprot:12506691-Prorocentrum_lima.AAC.1